METQKIDPEILKTLRADRSINTCGMVCPLPIIKTTEAAKSMTAGEVLEVLATDGAITIDMPAWCHGAGHEFLGIEQDKNILKVYVRMRQSATPDRAALGKG